MKRAITVARVTDGINLGFWLIARLAGLFFVLKSIVTIILADDYVTMALSASTIGIQIFAALMTVVLTFPAFVLTIATLLISKKKSAELERVGTILILDIFKLLTLLLIMTIYLFIGIYTITVGYSFAGDSVGIELILVYLAILVPAIYAGFPVVACLIQMGVLFVDWNKGKKRMINS